MAGSPGDEFGRDRAGDLDDAWQWGLETSRLMAERLIDLYSDVGTATFSRLAGDGDDLRQIRRDMERWVDLSVELFDRAFSVMRRLGDNADGNGQRTPVHGVSLIGLAGATCIGELWLHNLSDGDRTPPELRSTGLLSADGSEIPRAAVRFSVDTEPLNGHGRRRVSVIVDVPSSTRPGIYHGQILSDASPDAPVALRLDVRDG